MRQSGRGASILAALVMVAVLGTVALGIQYLGKATGSIAASTNESLLAQASAASSGASSGSINDACANGSVHTIDESTGAVQNPQESPPGGAKCWVPDPKAGTPQANPKDVGTMMPGPDAGSAACKLSQPDKCVVQYCVPSTMLSQSLASAQQGSASGCFVVNCGSVGGAQCLQTTLSTLTNTVSGPATVVGATLIANNQAAITIGTSNEAQFLTQALSPTAAQSVSNYVSSVNQQVPGGDTQLSALANAVQQGSAPCDTTASGCAPTVTVPSAGSGSVATNPSLSDVDTAQPPVRPCDLGGACPPNSDTPDHFSQAPADTFDNNGIAQLQPCAGGGDPAAGCSGGGSDTAPEAPCPAGQSGTPCTATAPAPAAPAAPAQAACTPSILNLWNCSTSKSTTNGNSTLGTVESLGASFLTGLLKGVAPSLISGVNNGIATPGNTVAQTPGTCSTQYICSNNMLYYQQNNCVQQAMQQCQYGCNGNSCAASNQSTAPYGYGTDGSICPQPPTQPTASQCTTGTWQQTSASNNGCVTGWQCATTNTANNSNTNGNASVTASTTAQLSCAPSTVDVGQSVSISYACTNAISARGSGFPTAGLVGTTTALMSTPPQGDNTATYTLACGNLAGQMTGAQCSVAINQPMIDLVAYPATTTPGTSSVIAWVTAGMNSCVASSAQDSAFTSANASFTSVSGVATTSLLSTSTAYTLTCQTLGGQTTATTTNVVVQ